MQEYSVWVHICEIGSIFMHKTCQKYVKDIKYPEYSDVSAKNNLIPFKCMTIMMIFRGNSRVFQFLRVFRSFGYPIITYCFNF